MSRIEGFFSVYFISRYLSKNTAFLPTINDSYKEEEIISFIYESY